MVAEVIIQYFLKVDLVVLHFKLLVILVGAVKLAAFNFKNFAIIRIAFLKF